MPEDMSDRMPEDLPVRKCINVMVGITRSKVICFFLRYTHAKSPMACWNNTAHKNISTRERKSPFQRQVVPHFLGHSLAMEKG
jgi:hypothetical protein